MIAKARVYNDKVFLFPCSVYMVRCKVEPSEIIEQAMIILVEGRSLELYNQTHSLWIIKQLRGAIVAMFCTVIKGSSMNPKLIVFTVILSLMPLCDGSGAPFLRRSSVG